MAAVGCTGALAITGLLAFEFPLARSHDGAVLFGFRQLAASPRIDGAATLILGATTPPAFAAIGAVFVAVALARGLRRLAVSIPLAMGAALGTSEALKPLLAHARHVAALGPDQIAAASWPSGHATGAMMVALCGLLVAPARYRPLVALAGGALTLAVSYSILVLGWHFPSDVLGGFLVAGIWLSLLLAVALPGSPRAVGARAPGRRRRAVGAALAPAVLACGGVVALALHGDLSHTLVRPDGWFVLGAIGIAALAAAMSAGLVAALATPDRSPRAQPG